jgi:predicted nucleic-acid-binding protein
VIGLDTNILARYFVADESDSEAGKQHMHARRLMESGQSLMVCKTVLLEFEWLLRGYYGFSPAQIMSVMEHLCALPNITLEDREMVRQAVSCSAAGLDFADALHHAAYRDCDSMATFDDRKFARRAKRMGLVPTVIVPAA